MKPITVVTCSIALLFALACSGGDATVSAPPKPTTPAATAPPPATVPTATAETDGCCTYAEDGHDHSVKETKTDCDADKGAWATDMAKCDAFAKEACCCTSSTGAKTDSTEGTCEGTCVPGKCAAATTTTTTSTTTVKTEDPKATTTTTTTSTSSRPTSTRPPSAGLTGGGTRPSGGGTRPSGGGTSGGSTRPGQGDGAHRP
jgi:hypothetical protein